MRWLQLFAVFFINLASTKSELYSFGTVGEGISLDDDATGINDISTIFNNATFNVNADVTLTFLESEFDASSLVLKWRTYVDDSLIAYGEKTLLNLRPNNQRVETTNETYVRNIFIPTKLTERLSVGSGVVHNSGAHNIRVDFELDGSLNTVERNYQSFDSPVSCIPLFIILALAVTTHMVEVSLGVGIFIGSCMITGSMIDGFKRMIDTYIVDTVANRNNTYMFLFALFLAGFVGILEKSGGIFGFSSVMSSFSKSTRSAQMSSFVTSFAFFFDDYTNILVVGPCFRKLQDSFMTSREKTAFIVHSTASSLASVSPISSWVGFEVGLIQMELLRIQSVIGSTPTIGNSGFGVLLGTISYCYFPIFMIVFVLLSIITQRDFGPMLVAERKVRVYGCTDGGVGKAEDLPEGLNKNKPEENSPVHWVNMIVPVLLLVSTIFYLLVKTGLDGSGQQSFLDIMRNADTYPAFLWGTVSASLMATLFFMLQFKKDGKFSMPKLANFVPAYLYGKILKYNGDEELPKPLMSWYQAFESFLSGMESMFSALVVLTLTLASGFIMTSVGLDRLVSQLLAQSNLADGLLPTIAFVSSVFTALATGSWGGMTIMFSLLLLPTYVASNGDPLIMYATTASIISGSAAADLLSPVSTTTFLSSMSSRCQLIEHTKTQTPYVGVVAVLSILVGTLPVGYRVYPNGVGFLLGAVCALLVTFILGRPIINKTGSFGPTTELFLKFYGDSELHALKKDTVTAFRSGGPVQLSHRESTILDENDISGEMVAEINEGIATGDESDKDFQLDADNQCETDSGFDRETTNDVEMGAEDSAEHETSEQQKNEGSASVRKFSAVVASRHLPNTRRLHQANGHSGSHVYRRRPTYVGENKIGTRRMSGTELQTNL